MPRPLLVLVLAAGCLGPQVSDTVVVQGLLLPAGATVPPLDADDADQIAANDGVGDVIPLLSGFADGKPVRFWDFGPAPDVAAPAFVLYRRTADNMLEKLPHPPIFGVIPGDKNYSPFWAKFVVEVTAQYQGELITSTMALDEALDRGLVLKPRLMPVNINCPIVHKGAKLEVADGSPPVDAAPFYYEGKQGSYFHVGETALAADSVHVPIIDLYELRREGGEPLSEPVRNVDIDGDGDRRDTNDVFAFAPPATGYSPLCRVTSVAVGADVASIDTTHDQTMAAVRAASDLFVAGNPTPLVVAYQTTTRLFDCPIQVSP
jgi:hypothetical protein